MSACDLMNHSMQCAKTDVDCITPRVKLSDETFIFIDGKWVNEIYHQPPFASHEKHFSKKTNNEWSIWEENRVLWEENKALWIENSMLWKENKALQCLQAQNKTVKVIYDDTIQQGLQKEKKSFPVFPESNIGFQVNQDNKALQIVREKNSALEIFRQENKAFPIIWKNKKAIAVHEESKDASSVLQKDTQTVTDPEEGNPGPAPYQEHKVGSSTPTQNEKKSAPAVQGEYAIGQAIQNLYQALQVFLKEDYILSGEKKNIQILQEENKVFQEENNKLRLQLNAVKNSVSDIMAQMEMLQKELNAITSPVYKEAGQILESEYQLGEM
ncbi:protein chibby homolog 2 [Apteryx mantelli]|uniref:Protein chibby homolog 2 n=1 Tax=Apteryx mantelli TaxID=2696672 RepID=A0A8B7IZH4_9AVES